MLALAFEAEMKKIINDVQNHSKQYYLDIQIAKPKPSSLKLGLLYLYLYSKSYTTDELRSICCATGLIQIGLDIHDWVTNERLLTPSKVETRQLQVLAGDYFSSLYYRLLASLGDRDSIRKIAQSVRKINQQKVIYYQHKDEVATHFERWLSLQKEIELGFFNGFIRTEDKVWLQLLDQFITLDILFSALDSGKWQQILVQKQIQASLTDVRDNIKKVENIEVIYELQKYVIHFENLSAPSLVAEEM